MNIGIRGKITLAMLVIIIISIAIISMLVFNYARAVVLDEIKQSNYETLKNANDYFLRK